VLEHGRKRVGRKVERDSGRHLFMAARWHEKKENGAGGSEVGAAWRAGTRKREPPRAQRGTTQAVGISPRLVGAGGAIAVRQGRVAGRR
jgi:hypothetical protein